MQGTVRPAAVAGYFYPEQPDELAADIASRMTAAAAGPSAPHGSTPADAETPAGLRPRMLIVPHAGYVYSGNIAASAYALVEGQAFDRVLLLGPTHRVYVPGMALPSVDAFATPLGNVTLDLLALDRLSREPNVVVSDDAHRLEHSLEVQLPFLQLLLGAFKLIPIAVGDVSLAAVGAVIDSLCDGEDDRERTLVVVSTDLSHFHPYEEARRLDAATATSIAEKTTRLTGEEACGAHALNGVFASDFADQLGIYSIALCNSGDTAGAKDRVVGYGSFVGFDR